MTLDAAQQKRSRDLRLRGALVLALFALLWAAVGASELCFAAGADLVMLAIGPSQEMSRVVIGLVAAGTLWATSVRLALRA